MSSDKVESVPKLDPSTTSCLLLFTGDALDTAPSIQTHTAFMQSTRKADLPSVPAYYKLLSVTWPGKHDAKA